MQKITSDKFFELQTSFSYIPYSQSFGWYRYQKARGEKLVFFADQLENPNIAFMGRTKSVPFVGTILLVEGELLKDPITNEVITEFYKLVAQQPYDGIEIDSNSLYSTEFEIGIRRAGFTRPLAFFSCPLSIIVDLGSPIVLNKNWKYNYRKALKYNLHFDEITEPTFEIATEFCGLYNAMASRKGLSYELKPVVILELVENKNMRFFFVRNENQSAVSGGIIYANEETSYYIFAANSAEANKNGASRLIIKSVFEKLASEGIGTCDFGRIPPSANATDHIYLFKKGIKGSVVQYNGEWVYHKSRIREYIFHIGKLIYGKPQRY
jgi:hypothetical protein